MYPIEKGRYDLIIQVDGSYDNGKLGVSRMGTGVEILYDGVLHYFAGAWPDSSNTVVAEFMGLLHGLSVASLYVRGAARNALVIMDAEIVVDLMSGKKKYRAQYIKEAIDRVWNVAGRVAFNITFKHVPREENKIADLLSKIIQYDTFDRASNRSIQTSLELSFG